MTKQNEISSTEKLLELIRAKSDSVSPVSPDPVHEPPEEMDPPPRQAEAGPRPSIHRTPSQSPSLLRLRRKFTFPSISIAGGNCSVGVDIGYQEVRLVKVSLVDGKTWKLIDYQVVPFDPDISSADPRFSGYLRSVLEDFCSDDPDVAIWSSVTSTNLEVRHLRIPKVPQKQLSAAVLWSFKKNNINFDEEKNLFDFEVQGEIIENEIEKIAVLAYSINKESVQQAKKLFDSAGFPLAGLTCIPFSLQNLFREGCLKKSGEVVCNLYIGREWSRIDIFSHGNLVMIRGVNGGTNSMVKGIMDGISRRLQEKRPSVPVGGGDSAVLGMDSPLTMENTAPEKDKKPEAAFAGTKGVTFEQARKVLFSLHPTSPPLTPEDPGYDLTESEVFKMVLPAVDRLTRQLERTFRYYSALFAGELVTSISICGNVETYGHMVDYISDQLGVAKSIFSPLASPESCFRTEILDHELVAESHSNAQALGLAISNNAYTPNFLFTHKDRVRTVEVKRVNRAVGGLFVFLMMVCAGITLWQIGLAGEREKEKEWVRQEMVQFDLVPDQNYLFKMVDGVKLRQQRFKAYSQRYLALAVITELAMLTPEYVSLLNTEVKLGPVEGLVEKSAGRRVELKGIVSGDGQRLESFLAEYIVVLESSPMFGQPEVRQSRDEFYKGRRVLYFILDVEIK